MNTVAPITSLSQTILEYFTSPGGQNPSEKIIGNTIKGLQIINGRGAGLTGFVETYRKLARIPQPEKKPVNVAQLFESIITLVKSNSENEKMQITREVSPSGLEIFAGKKQVAQVLINLLKNSLEALKIQNEGKIDIKGEVNSFGRVVITVSDNGPGISEGLIDKIFIPFFTAKESGSGVGLSLSRQIMLMHGGSLKLLSVPGKLTSAIIEF